MIIRKLVSSFGIDFDESGARQAEQSMKRLDNTFSAIAPSSEPDDDGEAITTFGDDAIVCNDDLPLDVPYGRDASNLKAT